MEGVGGGGGMENEQRDAKSEIERGEKGRMKPTHLEERRQ